MPELPETRPESTENLSQGRNADLDTIRVLVRLMHRYDLTAIDLLGGPTQIRLRRSSATQRSLAAGAAPAPTGLPQGLPSGPTAVSGFGGGMDFSGGSGSGTTPAAPAPPVKDDLVIESPMVGTFYSSSAPGSPPFVSVGSTVTENTTVCVIEAMKVFTDIPAAISGVITEIVVKNGQAVEFGQPLFRVKPH